MGVFLDTKTLIDNIPAHEFEYARALCQVGMVAALKESDMKAYFTFGIKEFTYNRLYWCAMARDCHLQQGRHLELRGWEVTQIYPQDTDDCTYLEPYFLWRFPGPAYA